MALTAKEQMTFLALCTFASLGLFIETGAVSVFAVPIIIFVLFELGGPMLPSARPRPRRRR